MYILLQVQNVIAYGLCYSRYDLLPSLARVSMATFITFPYPFSLASRTFSFALVGGILGKRDSEDGDGRQLGN